ncbi:MAG TPA: hypothetical protein PK624_13880 [Spirochaetota bacterium]|nr:hypothetical protein [Spirochaetota bacterium]HPK56633.1 hypothetical protein [Spirochaetota bacterium]
MEDYEIQSCIEIIFSNEISSLRNGTPTWNVNEKKEIVYEHAETLINMFSCLSDDKEKEEFSNILMKDILFGYEYIYDSNNEKKERIFISCTGLSFYTLIKLDYINLAIDSLIGRIQHEMMSLVGIFRILCKMVDSYSNYFDLMQIASLLRILKKYDQSDSYQTILKNTIINSLSKYGYSVIKSRVNKINIEINRDKESVSKKIQFLKFDEKYNDFLNELDIYLLSDSTVVSSGMIGNLRSFMENLLTDIANKIAKYKSEEIAKIENCGSMGNIRKYLQVNLELSSADNNLINKYIDVLHAEGGHSFTSNKEHFRLARNIGIEIVLLILTKYDNLINEKL